MKYFNKFHANIVSFCKARVNKSCKSNSCPNGLVYLILSTPKFQENFYPGLFYSGFERAIVFK